MKKYKISIIIPCYSVGEEFLNEALESITNQTYENWEIILVDDCSPKEEWKSKLVVDLIKQNKLILIKNNKNMGLAISRNNGFDVSSGEIILFLDSDDKYKSINFFEYLNKTFQKNSEIDLIQFQYDFLLLDSKKNWYVKGKKIKFSEKYYQQLEIKEYLNKMYNISSWNKAYKKSFLIENKIRHLNKKTPNEDWVFCFQIFSKKPNVFLTNQIFYLYRKRNNSITHQLKISKKSWMDNIKIIKNDIDEYLNRGGYNIHIYNEGLHFLSKEISILILKHGLNKCKNELEINEKILKKIIEEQLEIKKWKIYLLIKLKIIGYYIFRLWNIFKKILIKN